MSASTQLNDSKAHTIENIRPMKQLLQSASSTAQSRFYKYLFNKKIVYNACMEDPAVDTHLMDFDDESSVCMLASAGCNALHYAMEGAGRVDCIDANPCQYALVDLKLVVPRLENHATLWDLFAEGVSPNFRDNYKRLYRDQLQPVSREFWDRNLDLFDRGRLFKGFHFRTGCGFMTQLWDLIDSDAKSRIASFFDLDDTEEQEALFDDIFSPYYSHIVSRALVWFTVKFGIPSRQMKMIHSDATVVFDYLRDHIKASLTQTAARENYFHYLYFFGRYRREYCPEFLKESRFEECADSTRRVNIYNSYLADYLEQTETRYTHFCLLDHLDWLHHDPDLLERQWKAVLRGSKPGTKVLLRTYLDNNDWMSPFVENHTRLMTGHDLQREIAKDRVGIYNQTHLLEVTRPL